MNFLFLTSRIKLFLKKVRKKSGGLTGPASRRSHACQMPDAGHAEPVDNHKVCWAVSGTNPANPPHHPPPPALSHCVSSIASGTDKRKPLPADDLLAASTNACQQQVCGLIIFLIQPKTPVVDLSDFGIQYVVCWVLIGCWILRGKSTTCVDLVLRGFLGADLETFTFDLHNPCLQAS